jgi:hypothetical protein
MNAQQYPADGAYHEAGHLVVAASLEMKLCPLGVHVDSNHRGICHYDYRKPGQSGYDTKGKNSVISLFAGMIAQLKFDPNSSTKSGEADQDHIQELLNDMYISYKRTDEETLSASKEKLRNAEIEFQEKAKQRVNDYWKAIEGLAKAILEKPPTPRDRETEPDPSWSIEAMEKTLNGEEVVAELNRFEVPASLCRSCDEEG